MLWSNVVFVCVGATNMCIKNYMSKRYPTGHHIVVTDNDYTLLLVSACAMTDECKCVYMGFVQMRGFGFRVVRCIYCVDVHLPADGQQQQPQQQQQPGGPDALFLHIVCSVFLCEPRDRHTN